MNRWKDVLGIAASVVCAIHCALTPVLLAFLPSLSLTGWMASPFFHQIIALVCVGLVSISIWPLFQKYRNYLALGFSSVGLAFVLTAAFFLPDHCCSDPRIAQDVETITPVKKEYFCSCSSGNCVFHSHVAADSESENIGESESFEGGTNAEFALVSNSAGSENFLLRATNGEHDHVHSEHTASSWWSMLQPWMTPLGGLFLVIAHSMNMRERFGCGKKCDCAHKHPESIGSSKTPVGDNSRAA